MRITIEHNGEIMFKDLHPEADYYEAIGIFHGMLLEYGFKQQEELEEDDG